MRQGPLIAAGRDSNTLPFPEGRLKAVMDSEVWPSLLTDENEEIEEGG